MKRKHYKKNTRSASAAGFTLIEIMIVVVIVGLMSTVIVPKIMDRPEQARRVKARADIRNIESALALFKTDTGRYPDTSEGLKALVKDPGIPGYHDGGYLQQVPADPWGNPYIYLCPGTDDRDYDLESYGMDGEDGGTDENADIESWNLKD